MLHDLGKVVLELLKEQNPNLRFLLQSLEPAKLGSVLLKQWNLPEALWQCVAFQRHAEFSLPSKIPAELRDKVAILYVAHIVWELFRDGTEKGIPTTFIEEHMALLHLESYSPPRLALDVILPALKKKEKSFPSNFKKILKNASQQKPTEE
jgi:HD-like signal output (HDOD) protein